MDIIKDYHIGYWIVPNSFQLDLNKNLSRNKIKIRKFGLRI